MSNDLVLTSNHAFTDFFQIPRLPFRRGHRPTVLPTRVQRVRIRCAAISDGCVAVLEQHRCLMRCDVAHPTPHPTELRASHPPTREAVRRLDYQRPMAFEMQSPRWHILRDRPTSSKYLLAGRASTRRRQPSHADITPYQQQSTITYEHESTTDLRLVRQQPCTLQRHNHTCSIPNQ